MNNLRAHIVKLHHIDRADTDMYIRNEGREMTRVTKSKEESQEKEKTVEGNSNDNGKMVYVGETDTYIVHVGESFAYFKDSKQANDGVMESLGKRHCYTCKTCNKVMYHRSNMVDHVRSHSGMKLYRCALCYKGLSRKQNVVHHLKYIHFIDSDKVDELIVREKDFHALGETFSDHSGTDLSEVEKSVSNLQDNSAQKTDAESTGGEISEVTDDIVNKIESKPIESTVSTAIIKVFSPGQREKVLTDQNTDNMDTSSSLPYESEQFGQENVEVIREETAAGDLPYMILFPDDPELRTYQCKYCDFQCREENQMILDHVHTHKGTQCFQCAICCNYFRSQNLLKEHLTMSHKLIGGELEEVMELTGSGVFMRLEDSDIVNNTELDQSKLNHTEESNGSQRSGAHAMFLGSECNGDINSRGRKSKRKRNIEDFKMMNFDSHRLDESITDHNQSQDLKSINMLSDDVEHPSVSESNTSTVFHKDGEQSHLKNDVDDKTQNESNTSSPSVIAEMSDLASLKKWIASDSFASKSLAKAKLDDILTNLMDIENMTCRQCNKRCSNKSNLKQHVRFVHLDMKEFICVACNKKFNTKFNLKVHWRQHAKLGDRINEFGCGACGKYFSSQHFLDSHMMKKHPELGTTAVAFGNGSLSACAGN